MNQELRIKIFIYGLLSLTLYLLVIHDSLFIIHTSALSPTINPTSTATPSASIKDKLKALEAEIASRAGQFKLELTKGLQNKINIGFLTQKTDRKITFDSPQGTKSANLKEYTQYISKEKINLKSLKEQDFLIILGDIDENEGMIAKKVIKSEPPTLWQHFIAKVINTGKKAISIQIKDSQYSVEILPKANVLIDQKESKLIDLKLGDRIIIVGNLQESTISARFIYLVNNISSPSAITK